MAALVIVAGVLVLAVGVLAFTLRIESQIVLNPFHHSMSIWMNHWQLGVVTAVLALWLLLTGWGLLRLQAPALISAWIISLLVLTRGLLALIPPIETGDLEWASSLVAAALLAIILLCRTRAAFA
jgi:hypothetical protein